MSQTWRNGDDLVLAPPRFAGLMRAVLRGAPLVLLLASALSLVLLLRALERPLGPRLAPWVTLCVCRLAVRILGLRVLIGGRPTPRPGAMVANHSSWLDILVLNSQAPLVFVAKSEVASWPGIGWLARATGTLFVTREARREAALQAEAVASQVRAGQTLVIFPEGTSTDNRRVLPFRATLFAGLLSPDIPPGTVVQPVTLSYTAPHGEDPRFYAWFGDASFGPHALAVLAARRQGTVRVTFHAPIPVAGRDRKSLAAQAEAVVRLAL